jgi:RNA polymerase sigma-70 factor (ECF subfamily)
VAGSDTGGVARSEIERVFREVYGQAVATLVRGLGDITLAEDAVQHAFVVASEQWNDRGIPPNPAGWIITTARNRGIDHHRRETRRRELYEQLGADGGSGATNRSDVDVGAELMHDDQLRLIFTCCHPALASEHRVALTLRLLGGLTVAEVARSFLISETAMAKRLVRAKYKIKAANIPYRVPEQADLAERLHSVLAVLYLIYNTGADDPNRASLRADAIRLARALRDLMPDEPEVAGGLALMVLAEARMPARQGDGEIVLLRDQDRALWDRSMIDEGQAIVRECIRLDRPGPYQLQAAIQAVHCDASAMAATDWPQIVTLYDHLMAIHPTPIVALNRAIAVGEVAGPGAALAEIDAIAPDLANYPLMHAARGSALRRLGHAQDACEAYARAASLAQTSRDQRFLDGQVAELSEHA